MTLADTSMYLPAHINEHEGIRTAIPDGPTATASFPTMRDDAFAGTKTFSLDCFPIANGINGGWTGSHAGPRRTR
jgi:hypothetical protein